MINMRWILERYVVRVEDKAASASCPLAVFHVNSVAHRNTVAAARLLVTSFRQNLRTKISEEVLLISLYNL